MPDTVRPGSESPRMDPISSPLLTDLYELTMLKAYFESGMTDTAVFELFARKLPRDRNFFLFAGLEQALAFVERLRFSQRELEWIEASGLFDHDFVRRLESFRFTGDIHAMPEGSVFFPDEPVLRVTAPMPEAQLLETRVLNLIHFETVIASKAARSVLAAGGKKLIDFGLRRAHGAEAGLLAARASYLAGFDGTSTVLAAPLFGIPIFGTMAHSFVQAHDSEIDSFADFAKAFPKNAVLLIDTYDTVEAARKAVTLAGRLRSRGISVRGVRLDSGDLDDLSRKVRKVLDAGGLREAIIFASGNLDEYRVARLVGAGAPIDSFGIGTSLVTSSDAPALDAVYKLQEYAGRPRRKRSAGKATWPGRKQVYRLSDAGGAFVRDIVAPASEVREGEPLLQLVMKEGKRVASPSLEAARAHTQTQLAKLPERCRKLEPAEPPYPVEIAASLKTLAEELDRASAVDASAA